MRAQGIAAVSACALLTSGCTSVPPLKEDGIAIAAIVQRVKCEIAFAVPEPRPPWPTGPFQWMRGWTAKVDLTLTTNAQSALTPTAVFTKFMPTVAVPEVGNIQRSFTFGMGAGASTTAVRTEILSFSVSLEELRRWKRRGECDLSHGFDLYGNLGLQEWVESALAPVERRQLRSGRHPPPGGKSPPAPPVLPPLSSKLESASPCGPEQLAPLSQAKVSLEHYATIAERATENARRNGDRDDVQATYDEAAAVYGVLKPADADLREAERYAADLKGRCPQLAGQVDDILKGIRAGAGRVATAKTTVDKFIEALPHDPPIDSLSHSVQFVVALSGNVTPNWTLVNFKGPGASGSLASGSYTTTHTLNISMGSPGALPAEQARQLNNLVIIQNLGRSAQ